MIQLTTSAAPACGGTGAQTVAVKQAAIETIKRGFDRFVILDAKAANNVRVYGYTPVYSNTTTTGTVSSFGNSATLNANSYTSTSGGYPIIGGTHDQALVVKMFRDDDPAGSNAIPARNQLGEKWEEIVAKGGGNTC